MKDRNGKTLRAGYWVHYHYEGRDDPEPQTFEIVSISSDPKYLLKFPEDAEQYKPPYALLKYTDSDDALHPPFFSHEVAKLEIEDLI